MTFPAKTGEPPIAAKIRVAPRTVRIKALDTVIVRSFQKIVDGGASGSSEDAIHS